MKKYCVLFSGPIGSGKTPIANYLNNDSVRIEVMEDRLERDEKEYELRRSSRVNEIIESGIGFIYDTSIDRRWKQYQQMIKDSGYLFFIVSIDLSTQKLKELHKAKGYTDDGSLDRTIHEHQLFLDEFDDVVSVHINDEEFGNRMEIVSSALTEFINNNVA